MAVSDLNQLIKAFQKEYKTQAVTLGVHEDDPPRLATGIFAFDLASGGGFPEGRCSIVYGPEASMKTTLCLKAIATAQKKYPKKKAVFVDVEAHFSKPWATKMGVDCKNLVYVIPESAEQMVDITEALLYAKDVSVVVVDSLAALVTVHELNSEAAKAMVGTTGIIINKFYRKVSRALSMARRDGHRPTIICVNQLRSKIGVMYGSPETQPGGKAFQYANSLMVRVYGKDIYLEPEKAAKAGINKVMPAYKEIKFQLKKWKVPVIAPTGVFMLALQLIAHPPLKVGDSYDWNTVLAYLKSLELLVKGKAGWDLIDPCTGEVYAFDTQDDLKQRMAEDVKFDEYVKDMIITQVLKDEEPVLASE